MGEIEFIRPRSASPDEYHASTAFEALFSTYMSKAGQAQRLFE